MKYGFDTNVREGSLIFPVGIIENCEMTGVTFNGDGDYPNLEFTFKGPDGSELKHKEFEINESTEYAQQSMERMNGKVVHILRRFMSKDEAKIPEVSNFAGYAKAVIKLIGDKYKGVKLRVKATFNKKGYVSFPLFPDFLENMSVVPNPEDTKLRITQYDSLIKPQASKPSSTNGTPSPVSSPAVNANGTTDDLPF